MAKIARIRVTRIEETLYLVSPNVESVVVAFKDKAGVGLTRIDHETPIIKVELLREVEI